LGKELAGFDRSGTVAFASRTGLRSVRGFGLFCGSFLNESPSNASTNFVSPLFDRGEVKLLKIFVRPVNVPRDFVENLLETRFEGGVG
jgi:hypothetical protein